MDLSLARRVEAEILDDLAADDPRARRSRDDLRRIHHFMATLSIIRRGLDRGTAGFVPRTLLELGAGDGSMLLRLAQERAARWPGVHVTLLDRLHLASPQTLDGLRAAGWTPEVVAMDVFEWLATTAAAATDVPPAAPAALSAAIAPTTHMASVAPGPAHWDVIFANLFIHHFAADALARLLAGIAARARVFVCCEPRRTALPLAGSHLIGLLGAGPVTREDAVLSVRAGFRARELSDLWPDRANWILHEYPAGLFSHCFVAIRKVS